MLKLQTKEGNIIVVEEKSLIYNCDLLVSYRDFLFEEVIKIPYSSRSIKAIMEKYNVTKLKMKECLEICQMSDFLGISDDYVLRVYDRLGFHLTKM